jgi:hypothetical protein
MRGVLNVWFDLQWFLGFKVFQFFIWEAQTLHGVQTYHVHQDQKDSWLFLLRAAYRH